MKWNIALVTVVLLMELHAVEVNAQTITIQKVDDSNAGQFTVTTKPDLPANWSVTSVSVLARPPKGAAGEGGHKKAENTGGGIYVGTITGLTSGNSYDVQAILFAKEPDGTQHVYFSAVQANQKVK